MREEQKSVRDWMTANGQAAPPTLTVPDFEARKLRAKLILEEALETIEGLGIDVIVETEQGHSVLLDADYLKDHKDAIQMSHSTPSIIKIADGIADSLVVQLGTAVACGIDIKPVFTEVMRSNGTKAWTLEDLNSETFLPEYEIHGRADDNFNVKDADGKIIKSPSYSPADIAGVLGRQQ